jgi:hypothetical protein
MADFRGFGRHLVKVGTRKELKEIEIIGREKSLDIVARHHFGISIISFSLQEAIEFRDEIDEWLVGEELLKKSDITV